MLKYTSAEVTFAEVPDEITLAINISNCPCHCKGCHSAYLAEDIGTVLISDLTVLGYTGKDCSPIEDLIYNNKGITCVAFMGGDSSPEEINELARMVRKTHKELKIAWYSGRQELSKDIDLKNFDFIKLGPYIEDLGPLNSKSTNQRFYKVQHNHDEFLDDITFKFWKDND